MMGRQVDQDALFYGVRLEDRVPAGHLLRRIDAIFGLSFVCEVMAPHYVRGGPPSVDPELLLRMLLVGYLYGVRSKRLLREEVDLNLAYRWFCRLELDGSAPDHSIFTKNRHGRFRKSGLMRDLFERIVEQYLVTGLADTDHVVVDGSDAKADANKQRCVKTVSDLPHAGAGHIPPSHVDPVLRPDCGRPLRVGTRDQGALAPVGAPDVRPAARILD